jgi:hypothetical protein
MGDHELTIKQTHTIPLTTATTPQSNKIYETHNTQENQRQTKKQQVR